jgi:hypothetical protein
MTDHRVDPLSQVPVLDLVDRGAAPSGHERIVATAYMEEADA